MPTPVECEEAKIPLPKIRARWLPWLGLERHFRGFLKAVCKQIIRKSRSNRERYLKIDLTIYDHIAKNSNWKVYYRMQLKNASPLVVWNSINIRHALLFPKLFHCYPNEFHLDANSPAASAPAIPHKNARLHSTSFSFNWAVGMMIRFGTNMFSLASVARTV